MRRILTCLVWIAVAAVSAHGADDSVDEIVRRLERNAREPFEQREREAALRDLARLATSEAAEAVVPLLDDPFEHLRDHAVSAWITMLRANRTGELHTWFVQRLVRHRSASVRAGVATALGLSSGAEIAADVRSALAREKDADVLVAWCRAALDLREHPDLAGAFPPLLAHKDGRVVHGAALACVRYEPGPEVDEALRRAATRHRDPRGRAGALLGLAGRGAVTAEDVERALRDDAHEPRVAVALALPAGGGPLAWPEPGRALLVRLLEDASWRVRTAAVQAALQVWKADVVVPLIDRLEPERGRVRDDIHRALVTLTGGDVGPDAQLWKAWWSARGTSFDPGERPEADRAGRIRFRAGTERSTVPGTQTVAFYDLPLASERLVFVFDLSGSMGKEDSAGQGRTKLDVLRERFGEVLAALPPETQFDVWVYRYPSDFPPKPRLERAFDKLQPLTPGQRQKAERWLARQDAKGWGAFFEPIEVALQEDVDTLVLLSDGVPSRGRYERTFRLVDEVARANVFAGLHVDTILAGTRAADRSFMEDLAGATAGRSSAAGD
jgi:HEAT repeat protein